MVKTSSFVLILLVIFASTLPAAIQHESGSSLMESVLANSEAIVNYDVSYKHWQGYEEADAQAKDAPKPIECLTFGRIVVDRKDDAVLLVTEITYDSTKGQQKHFECIYWRKGIETSFSKVRPRLNSRKIDFSKFSRTRNIPIVELTMYGFPTTLSKGSLNEDRSEVTQLFQRSKITRHPDGSSTVFVKTDNGRIQSQINFDPVSSMPTQCTMSEFDPVSNKTTREIVSGRPRYEKAKDIYRVVSINYNELEMVGEKSGELSFIQSVGTCSFTWHQFNEDLIAFPMKDGVAFDVDEAKRFLHSGKGEQEK